MVTYTDEMRERISEEAQGKVVDSLVWEPEGPDDVGYWIMTFDDGTEITFRLMAEIDTE